MLTLLTRPALVRRSQLWSKSNPLLQDTRLFLRRVRGLLKGRGFESHHPGHSAVTGSLVRGLGKLPWDFELNPYRLSNNGPIGILAGSSTLRWAIESPVGNASTKFVVGPNVNVLASENPAAFASDRVGAILVPSLWVSQLWSLDSPNITEKLHVWPCGVDFEYWKPAPLAHEPRLPLIYLKIPWSNLRERVVETLRQAGIEFREVTYGSYSAKQYKSLLQMSSCVIYIGGSESQGLALLEAWAMNVPTFVFDALSQDIDLTDGRSIKLVRGEFSPAPYLTSARGALWSDAVELPELARSAESYSPRTASISEFTDEIRAKHYLQIAAL